jgi:molybdate transport system substrate-binding protein
MRQRIGSGEAVDVAFITTPVVAELAHGGHLAASSITPIGRAGIGVGIRAGGRRFDIGTPEALKQTLLAARSVTFAREGASRPHLERMFEQLGIAEQMRAKTLLEPGSGQAAEKVIAGEAEILLTLEISPVPGMELVGPLPAEFQSYITFDAAVGARSAEAAAARAFIACVAAPSAAPAFAAQGIER